MSKNGCNFLQLDILHAHFMSTQTISGSTDPADNCIYVHLVGGFSVCVVLYVCVCEGEMVCGYVYLFMPIASTKLLIVTKSEREHSGSTAGSSV